MLNKIRIKHTIILDDPFDDPEGLVVPDKSPEPTAEMLKNSRIGEDEEIFPDMAPEELEKIQRKEEADARKLTLEMVGDLPFAEIKPPENVLFVCKLNPITRDEDLELLFSRFGEIRRYIFENYIINLIYVIIKIKFLKYLIHFIVVKLLEINKQMNLYVLLLLNLKIRKIVKKHISRYH